MFKRINDVNIHYEFNVIGSDITIVLLHGWGQNIEMMKPIGDLISDKYHVTIIDLPGHGESSEPKTPFTIYDY